MFHTYQTLLIEAANFIKKNPPQLKGIMIFKSLSPSTLFYFLGNISTIYTKYVAKSKFVV